MNRAKLSDSFFNDVTPNNLRGKDAFPHRKRDSNDLCLLVTLSERKMKLNITLRFNDYCV